jgi:hypothetical protein
LHFLIRSVNLTLVTKIYQLQWTCESAVFLSRALSEAKAKAELSANHTCALKECKSKTQHEFSAAGRVEHSVQSRVGAEPKAKAELSANHTCALKECKLVN